MTPPQNRFLQVVTDEKGSITNEALRHHLQTLLGPRSHRDLPVLDFVKFVYNYRPEQIPRKKYYLARDYRLRFCEAQSEVASYKPLQQIFDSLKQQL